MTGEIRAAIYVRLSREDGDKEESNSIRGQKELIRAYLADKPEIHICAERVDDGFSGATFQRPGFQRMLDEIREGKLNCVIVKDLSRFGRNYIEAGRYIEQIFPFLGVRFIAVNDGYDSARSGVSDSLLIPFQNLINDAYCRDISMKIRSQLAVKRSKGEFIGAFAPYGYGKDPENHNQLVPDPPAARVVREIFRWKLGGISGGGIAKKLTELGIPSPAAYKKAMGQGYYTPLQSREESAWSPSAVGNILTNPVYIGTLEQGKSASPNFRVRQRTAAPKDAWVRVETCHQPLVSREDFELVQRLALADTRTAPGQEKVYLLSGLFLCGDCGQSMVRSGANVDGKRYLYYICGEYKRDRSCTRHKITPQPVEEGISAMLQIHLELLYTKEQLGELLCTLPATEVISPLHQTIIAKRQALTAARGFLAALYEDLKAGVLDQTEYEELRQVYRERCAQLEETVAAVESQLTKAAESSPRESDCIQTLRETGRFPPLTREMAFRFVEQIKVFEEGRLEIRLRYTLPWEPFSMEKGA